MTSEHRYPLAALLPDYGRGLVGTVLSGGAWSLAPAAPAAIVIFGGLTGLFLVFTIRNVWRHRMRITLGGDGLAVARHDNLSLSPKAALCFRPMEPDVANRQRTTHSGCVTCFTCVVKGGRSRLR